MVWEGGCDYRERMHQSRIAKKGKKDERCSGEYSHELLVRSEGLTESKVDIQRTDVHEI